MCYGCYGCYRLQRIVLIRDSCCDLLSFLYLCRTGNNPAKILQSPGKVVICFHFTIFVVLETTQSVLFVVCQCIIEIAGI